MEVQASAKRRGRPPKDGEGKRTNFNTRLRNSLRAQLERDAQAAGRSLSEEIEVRLEHSLSEAKTWGGHRNMAAFHALAAFAFAAAGVTGNPESWLHDPEIFEDTIKYWRASLKATGIAPGLKDYPDDDDGAKEEDAQ